jgi:hypothetical protein
VHVLLRQNVGAGNAPSRVPPGRDIAQLLRSRCCLLYAFFLAAAALFFFRVAAALSAVARRLRVAAALRPAARRFRVAAAFCPDVSVVAICALPCSCWTLLAYQKKGAAFRPARRLCSNRTSVGYLKESVSNRRARQTGPLALEPSLPSSGQ